MASTFSSTCTRASSSPSVAMRLSFPEPVVDGRRPACQRAARTLLRRTPPGRSGRSAPSRAGARSPAALRSVRLALEVQRRAHERRREPALEALTVLALELGLQREHERGAERRQGNVVALALEGQLGLALAAHPDRDAVEIVGQTVVVLVLEALRGNTADLLPARP